MASNANVENLAESGGEDSEEEWNYIPGKDTKPDLDTKDHDDMSSQLNPDAAEFVPVMMLDDAIISASPRLGFEKSLDDIDIPSELEFKSEIAHRPGDLEIANGPKHGDDCFMRDNFSTLRNKGVDATVSSTCAELGDDSIISFSSSNTNNSAACASEDMPFDKMDAVQTMEERVTSGLFEKANEFGASNDFVNNTFEATNIFRKNDPMTTSIMGFTSSPEPDESLLPGTPKSMLVEAPVSPSNEDIAPLNHQTDLDSPAEECLINTDKTPELISPSEGPQEGLTPGQERTSSSGFESEGGTEEGEINVPEEDSNAGFITEQRRSPPIDLSFKPIQNFSDTNPFGALQTPSSTTPLDQIVTSPDVHQGFGLSEPLFETPKKDAEEDKSAVKNTDFLQNTPSSFISLRKLSTEQIPAFNELESPKDIPHFELAPNANSSVYDSEWPKSPEPENSFEHTLSSIKQEPEEFINEESLESKEHLTTIKQEPELQETSFTTVSALQQEATSVSHADLDTTAGFLYEESKIQQDSQECEQISKLVEDVPPETPELSSEVKEENLVSCDISPKAVEQVLAAFDEIKDDHEFESKPKTHEESKDSDTELETKEMKLEFESHISDSKTSPEDLNMDDGFEVISKEELTQDNITLKPSTELKDSESSLDYNKPFDLKDSSLSQEHTNVMSPTKQTNPFMMDNSLPETENMLTLEGIKAGDELVENSPIKSDLLNAIDTFNSAVTEDLVQTEQSTLLSSPFDLSSPVEPQAMKTVSYQTLTPADEPKLSKTASYVTGIEDASTESSPLLDTVTEFTKITEEITKPEEPPVLETEEFTKTEEPTILETQQVTENVSVSRPVETESPIVEESVVTKSEPVQSQVSAGTTEEPVLIKSEPVESHVIETPDKPDIAINEQVQSQISSETLRESVLIRNEPVQSQVVTETLITALEETSEVPSVATTEVPSSAGTPPPTPAPGLDSKEDSPKTDILVAAVAAAGAVAAGTAIAAEKEVKKSGISPIKKSTTGVSKKPIDTAAKAPSKPATKAPASKPAATKTTSTITMKATSTATKISSSTAAPKTTATKTSTAPTVAKKAAAPTSAGSNKTATTIPKTNLGAPPKQVPNKLSVNKTAAPIMKPSSKPSTPTSKPTTPTMPKSPSVAKTEVKSPPRPAPRPTTKSAGVTKSTDKSTEKKPLMNGEIKPLVKKTEVLTKKPMATTTTKPNPSAPKTTAPAKTASAVAAKTATTKTAPSQPKPATITRPASSVPAKRPASATATKLTDKTGKETANKQISNTKTAVNGKIAPAKTTTGVKKTDAKVNGKTNTTNKPAPIKKPEEMKKLDAIPTQIQEDNVTTTNGFAEHESLKIEELSPVITEGVVN